MDGEGKTHRLDGAQKLAVVLGSHGLESVDQEHVDIVVVLGKDGPDNAAPQSLGTRSLREGRGRMTRYSGIWGSRVTYVLRGVRPLEPDDDRKLDLIVEGDPGSG